MPKMEGPDNSRRGFLKKIGILGATAMVMPDKLFSQTVEQQEQNRTVESCRMESMENNGNLKEGFSRYLVALKFAGEAEKIDSASFFSLENKQKAKADFVSNKMFPGFFDGEGINFDDIKSYYERSGKKVTMIVAGAYHPSNSKEIEGIALQDGNKVGQDIPKSGNNGLLVIRDGNPEIQYVNQIPDLNAYLAELESEGADLFQQKSFIRPGGSFSSSIQQRFELRFFVEGQVNGVNKKGVLNFSQAMTQTEAVEAMQKMKGFNITKAIGLDTGFMSEGYFYDHEDKKILMIDENMGKHREDYTNALVLYSQ